jgi:hypothetical protein
VDRLVLGRKLGVGCVGSTKSERWSRYFVQLSYPVPILGAGVNPPFLIISFNLAVSFKCQCRRLHKYPWRWPLETFDSFPPWPRLWDDVQHHGLRKGPVESL